MALEDCTLSPPPAARTEAAPLTEPAVRVLVREEVVAALVAALTPRVTVVEHNREEGACRPKEGQQRYVVHLHQPAAVGGLDGQRGHHWGSHSLVCMRGK